MQKEKEKSLETQVLSDLDIAKLEFVEPTGDSFSGDIKDEFRGGFKTSEEENQQIKEAANSAENDNTDKQQLIFPDNLEKLIATHSNQSESHLKVYQNKPFIKNQIKVARNSTRIKERVIKVFDLAMDLDLKQLNSLVNNSIKEDTAINNLVLREHFSEKDGTWKVLATYDILEFTNPL